MIHPRKQNPAPVAEPETGRPAGTGEEWLGRNRSSKRRLWERLNPRSRRQIRLIAEALALQQTHAQLPDSVRGRLSAAGDGCELVRKDKIESIIPSTPAGKPEPASAGKKDTNQHPSKPAADLQPQAEPAVASSSDASATPTNASVKTVDPGTAGKTGKTTPKKTNAAGEPEGPASTPAANVRAPASKEAPPPTTPRPQPPADHPPPHQQP